MRAIGKFHSKIVPTTDRKKLKKTNKNYTYGTISIRSPDLTEHVGEKVLVRVFIEDEKTSEGKE